MKVENVWTFSTPLHLALMKNCERLVKILLAHGADTRIPYREDERITTCLELTKQLEPFLSLITKAFEWTPENHELLPLLELRKKIKWLHMCFCHSTRGGHLISLDLDSLSLIYTFVCHEYFFE